MTSIDSSPTDSHRASGRVVSLAPGQVLGDRYRVEEELGTGGMGVVCRATHLGLGTPVAIKLIRPDFAENEEFVRRFLNEARRAALLRSERIAHVHDVGQLETGEPFLVMELLEGVELGRYLEEHDPLSEVDAISIALQIAEGLEAAHRCGIVHRDVKPANTFLVRRPDGRFSVKILDFGISKQLAESTTTITDAGQSLGSPWYMSPEQMMDASRVDERSDLWSLGVVLFEMLAGRRPFDGVTLPEVCAKVLTSPAPLLSVLRPEIDPELEAIVARCLEKEPAHRYPDMASLGAALRDCLARHAVPAEASVEPSAYFDDPSGSIVPVATTRMSFRRRRRFAHAFGIVGILLTLGIAGLAFGRRTMVSVRNGAARLGADFAADAPPKPPVPPPLPVVVPEPPLVAEPDVPTPVSSPEPSATVPAPDAPPTVAAPEAPPAATSEATTAAPEATMAAAPEATTAAAPERTPAASAPAARATAVRRPTRPAEAALTAAEIERRKEEYSRWLDIEGLKPVGESGPIPKSEPVPSDEPSPYE